MSAGDGWIVDVGDADFEREVLERSRSVPVVVDFWAAWCGPCRLLGPLLEEQVTARQGEVVLAKVDIDRAPGLAATFDVRSVPTVVAFRDGRPVETFAGVLPKPALERFFDGLAPSAADRAAEAAAAVEASEPEAAERGYRDALAQDARHEAASVGLARLLVARGADDEARRVLSHVAPGREQKDEIARLEAVLTLRALAAPTGGVEAARARLEASPDDPGARYALGCALAAAGDHPAALEALYTAGQADKALAKAEVREAMVHVFAALGPRHPLTGEYRDKLAMLLY